MDVRQRQYAIGLRGEPNADLVTENVFTCSALVGVNRDSGVIFMCHMNTPLCIAALPELVSELRPHVHDVRDFDVYTSSGLHPLWLWLLALGLVWCLAKGHYLAGFGLAGALVFLSATRMCLAVALFWLRRQGLWRSAGSLGYSWKTLGLLRCGVKASANTLVARQTASYARLRFADRFKVAEGQGLWMVKAIGSA